MLDFDRAVTFSPRTMRFSELLCPTLREDPAEADVVSHRLMLRSGMIRQLSAGIYT